MSLRAVNSPNLESAFFSAAILSGLLLCTILIIFLPSPFVLAPPVIATLAYSVYRWPTHSIACVLFLMPFLPLFLVALKATGVPWAQAASSSKELALLGAAIVLARRQGLDLEKRDLPLIGLFAWAVAISMVKPTPSTWIGLKDDFDFALAFFVGRLIVLSPRWVKTGLWIASIVAVLGLVEFFVLGSGPRMILMGISDPADLPVSFRADLFEGIRAGSTLGGPLEFGGFCAVVLLVFATFYRGISRKYFLLALLIALGLVASVTRMAGLGLALGLVLIAIRTGQKLRLAAVVVGSAILLLAVIIPVMGLQGFVAATISGQDSSLTSHRTSVLEKTSYLLSHPLGAGAGSVGPRAAARDPNALEVESGYILFGMEYGWPGLALFVLFCGFLFVRLWHSDSSFGLAACAVLLAMITMLFFSPIHMDFGLNSWAWVIIGSGLSRRV